MTNRLSEQSSRAGGITQMGNIVGVERTRAVGMALAQIGICIIRAYGLAQLSDVIGCCSCCLASALTLPIVAKSAIRTNSDAIS
jgi:hypothetical protein